METIEKRAHSAAWQIKEEIGLSEHSIERVTAIIKEKLIEQKTIDIEEVVSTYAHELEEIIDVLNKIGINYNIDKLGEILSVEGCVKDFRKAMED